MIIMGLRYLDTCVSVGIVNRTNESIAHMGMITAACFSINPIGKTGAIVLMLSHGLTRSALFALMSYLYERHKSRLIKNYQGIRQTTPILSTLII